MNNIKVGVLVGIITAFLSSILSRYVFDNSYDDWLGVTPYFNSVLIWAASGIIFISVGLHNIYKIMNREGEEYSKPEIITISALFFILTTFVILILTA